jgi:hypothetical protein
VADSVLLLMYWLILIVLAAVAWFAWTALRGAIFRRMVEMARRDFVTHHATYEEQFLAAAAASGKPRGLRWTQCRFHDAPALTVWDKATRELVNLVSVTISFEAIEGGGMEKVEAVGDLRCATAVFTWTGRVWTTQGRAIFNLEPQEVLERYRDSLELVSAEEVN